MKPNCVGKILNISLEQGRVIFIEITPFIREQDSVANYRVYRVSGSNIQIDIVVFIFGLENNSVNFLSCHTLTNLKSLLIEKPLKKIIHFKVKN